MLLSGYHGQEARFLVNSIFQQVQKPDEASVIILKSAGVEEGCDHIAHCFVQ